VSATPAHAADTLGEALATIESTDLVPGADRFAAATGSPPVAAAYNGDALVGYAFLNTEVVGAIGYSGKPIHILIAIDPDGTITGAKLHEHFEPIVLVGIPEARVVEFIDGYVGRNVRDFGRVNQVQGRTLDIISGATVTVMVIDDTIIHSALKVARALGIGDLGPTGGQAEAPPSGRVDMSIAAIDDWITLVGDGSVRRLNLSVAEVTANFEQAGKNKAAARPESDNPDDVFIDLYAALVSVPTIGRSLLGDAEYDLLSARLEPDQHAILIIANGLYSFKGSGYVRGGIFDRIQLIQRENSIRFRDRDHKRLGRVEAAYAQDFREVGLFILPKDEAFDPTSPWRLELLVHRAIGALEKDFLTYDLRYTLPDRYVERDVAAAPVVEAEASPDAGLPADDGREPLWQRVWRNKLVDVGVLAAALVALTGIFFFQNWFARRPKLSNAVRIGFLLFTTVWIGLYAQAQLSVVNVLTFGNSLITAFKWDYFLIDPLIFILWVGVAGSLLFWGRGPFCGWLCPFGALQELLNKGAKLLRIPQLELPWGLHERLWSVKYIIFLGLGGLSLYSLGFAEQMAEVEPFKTAVVLRFMRDWPFVLYAGLLLAVGLFIERFFCRYLCPLGAALAIPGRLRIFEWLLRHKECGAPCHRCAKECMVQAIHPDGHINPNECLYCLHCQELYYDEHLCPAMIQRRLKRERRQAMASPSISAGGVAHAVAAAPEVRLKGLVD
jgi:NosR/NirI family nitrous oxide reductase transcriptional regulator